MGGLYDLAGSRFCERNRLRVLTMLSTMPVPASSHVEGSGTGPGPPPTALTLTLSSAGPNALVGSVSAKERVELLPVATNSKVWVCHFISSAVAPVESNE